MTRSLRHAVPRAFTLIELMACVVILAVIGTVSASLILQSLDSYADAAAAAELQTEESATFDRITRAVASIALDPDYAGIAPYITAVRSNYLEWCDSDGRRYELKVVSDRLEFIEAGAADVRLLNNVTNFRVRAYDQNNTALAENLAHVHCHAIRRVSLEITLQRNGRSQTLRTKVYIRCMMAEGT